MPQNINQLTELDDIEDSELSETFTANINCIFQYVKKDISECLDKKSNETVKKLSCDLFDLFKEKFPAYSAKKPINRKAKHLMIEDIFSFGYSIANEQVAHDIDQIFTRNTSLAIASEEIVDEQTDLAQLIVSVSNLQRIVNSLQTKNNELNKKLNDLQIPVCKCVCKGVSPQVDKSDQNPQPKNDGPVNSAATASTSSGSNARQAVSPPMVPRKSDESSLPSSFDSESDDGFHLPQRQRKKKQRAHKKATVKSSKGKTATVLSAASKSKTDVLRPAASAMKRVYVGNVNPAHSAGDIASHIKEVTKTVNIPKEDVKELYKGEDGKSFCVTVPEADFDEVLNSPWPKGIKVRKFYPKSNRPRQKPQHKPNRNESRKHNHGRYRTNYNGDREDSSYQMQPFRWDSGYRSYPSYSSWESYDTEWPRLPRPTRDDPWYYDY